MTEKIASVINFNECSDLQFELCSHRKRLLDKNHQLKMENFALREERRKLRTQIEQLDSQLMKLLTEKFPSQ